MKWADEMTIREIAARFKDARENASGYYLCTCPCHPDRYHSLTVSEHTAGDGSRRAVITCHAGCDTEKILQAAGLLQKDLETAPAPEMGVVERARADRRALTETVERALTVGIETGKGVREVAVVVQHAVEAMAAMAETVRVTNERMGAIEEEMRGLREMIRTMEKVTPEQARNVNRLIRQRAKDICEEYRMGQTVDLRPGKGRPGGFEWVPDPDKAAKLTAAIRADVREMTGVRNAREIARCDWDAVTDYIIGWDEYETIQKIRKGGRTGRKGSAEPADQGERKTGAAS